MPSRTTLVTIMVILLGNLQRKIKYPLSSLQKRNLKPHPCKLEKVQSPGIVRSARWSILAQSPRCLNTFIIGINIALSLNHIKSQR